MACTIEAQIAAGGQGVVRLRASVGRIASFRQAGATAHLTSGASRSRIHRGPDAFPASPGTFLSSCDVPMSTLVLAIIILVLLFGWGGGMAMHIGGSLIHALLVIAVIVVVVRLVTGGRAA